MFVPAGTLFNIVIAIAIYTEASLHQMIGGHSFFSKNLAN